MPSLRAVSPGERSLLYEMTLAYWQELMPRAPVVRDPSLGPQYFDRQFRLERDCRQWWILLADERIGFANVELRHDPGGQRWGYIKDFYIAPAWRRQGHGRGCAQRIIEWLKAAGAAGVDLQCRLDNPTALAFWQALGFEIVSYRLRYYFLQ